MRVLLIALAALTLAAPVSAQPARLDIAGSRFVLAVSAAETLTSTELVGAELEIHEQFAILGDYNIAPEDRDVHDPELWAGQIHCSDLEREQLRELCGLGLVDAFRLFEQPEKQYSWWDYRQMAFRRNRGLRIDHILLSQALAKRCEACVIDREPRKWEQPSDHTPVIATLL